MNMLPVLIEDIVKTEEVEVNGVKKIRIHFNTICWGVKAVKVRIFNNLNEWLEFSAGKYYRS